MSAVARRLGRPLLGIVVFLALLAFWELWARGADSFLVPAASTVAEAAWHVWPSGEFLGHVAASLRRLAAGYAIGAGVGVAAGLVLGSSRLARRATEPVLEFLRAIPPIAIVPALIGVLGVGDGMRVAVIAFGVLWPVLLNSVDGVRAVSPELRDTAALLQTGRVERVVRVYLPAALPSIFAGLRIALGVGLVMVVISEFVGGGDGIGHYIVLQQTQFSVPETYAGILFLGVLGYVLNALFLAVERRVLAWHHGAVGARAR